MTDQTFFAAYGPPTSAVGRSKPVKPASPPATHSGRHGTGPSIESQYSDGSWYRMDAPHRIDGQGPGPHYAAKAARPESVETTSPVSQNAEPPTAADLFGGWANSCVVMAAPMLHPVVDLVENELDEAPTNAIPSAPPVEVVEHPVEEESETSEAEVVQESTPARWSALWEVDEFLWTDDLLRLQSSQAEYFRYAGEKLLEASREGLKTLAVVSTREKEGCTTMAVCLAQAAANAGARVALVDANLDHPELGPKLGLDFSHGWQEAIGGKSTLAEAAVLGLDTGLTLLPLSATHRLTCLNESRISDTLSELAQSFDLVIIDAGVAPAGDAEMFASGEQCPINAALIVRDLRRTSETETLVTASRLKSLGIDAIGIAENFVQRQDVRSAAA